MLYPSCRTHQFSDRPPVSSFPSPPRTAQSLRPEASFLPTAYTPSLPASGAPRRRDQERARTCFSARVAAGALARSRSSYPDMPCVGGDALKTMVGGRGLAGAAVDAHREEVGQR